jgi:quinol-cytochrome oxidoreductase complex cytochrome b subunit
LQGRQVALQILRGHILAHEQVLIPRALRDTVALEAFSAHVHQERFLQRGRPFVPHVMQVNILLLPLVLVHLSLLETILALEQALIQSAPQDIVALVVFLQSALEVYILQ